mmetsp:Transcript_34631/g.79257  ORF Transcript_34631/g.79257 Transcript_34631/m.79257 type:complete len:244 (+) Transcript_34631:1550-2281(+)
MATSARAYSDDNSDLSVTRRTGVPSCTACHNNHLPALSNEFLCSANGCPIRHCLYRSRHATCTNRIFRPRRTACTNSIFHTASAICDCHSQSSWTHWVLYSRPYQLLQSGAHWLLHSTYPSSDEFLCPSLSRARSPSRADKLLHIITSSIPPTLPSNDSEPSCTDATATGHARAESLRAVSTTRLQRHKGDTHSATNCPASTTNITAKEGVYGQGTGCLAKARRLSIRSDGSKEVAMTLATNR